MYTVTENITPELARFYLKNNRNNRPISADAVKTLAFDMLKGRFVTTEQGIAFDENMNLVDGQHRLHAIVQSGCAQTMRVTLNAPNIDAPRDRGRIRRVGDFLLDGSGTRVAKSTRVAAACSAIELLLTRSDTRPSVDAIRACYEEHRSGVDWVIETLPGRTPAFVHGALAYAYPCHPARVDEFAHRYVALAPLGPGSPVLALHRAVVEASPRRTSDRIDMMLRTLRCAQLYILGRSVQRITQPEDGLHYFRDLHTALRASARTA
jgi:hypothetical protein